MVWGRRLGGPEHTDAWSFYEWLGDRPRQVLTREQAEVAAICDLRQEANSGGFDGYFRSRGSDTAELALSALPSAVGQRWAELLRAAMSQLGEDYPSDVDAREQRLNAPGVNEALHALDERFYELEATVDADALLSHHLTNVS